MQPLTAPSSAPGIEIVFCDRVNKYVFSCLFQEKTLSLQNEKRNIKFTTMKENGYNKSLVVDTWNGIDIYSKNCQNGFGMLTKGK